MTDTQTTQPQVMINAQYVKDLSFESPKAPASLAGFKNAPEIELSVDINVQKVTENDLEVALLINATAKYENEKIFIVELKYAGLFSVLNMPDDAQKEQVLLIYCPSILFPFARRIISDVTRDGGFQPLMIAPIDFASLYMQHKTKQNSETQN